MSISFTEAMCIFIADCMVIVGMNLNKAASILEMAKKANALFADFTPTPAKVAEVKDVILSFA